MVDTIHFWFKRLLVWNPNKSEHKKFNYKNTKRCSVKNSNIRYPITCFWPVCITLGILAVRIIGKCCKYISNYHFPVKLIIRNQQIPLSAPVFTSNIRRILSDSIERTQPTNLRRCLDSQRIKASRRFKEKAFFRKYRTGVDFRMNHRLPSQMKVNKSNGVPKAAT